MTKTRDRISDKGLGTIGAAIMLAFAAVSTWRWLQTDMLFFALLAFRDLVASFFLFRRREAEAKSNAFQKCIAYLSSGLTLFYQQAVNGVAPTATMIHILLVIAGFSLATLATVELGFSFGISPANRGARVSTGVYRYFRHPMYVGYVVAELGMVLIDPRVNGWIFLISLMLYVERAKMENILTGKSS